jgi:eukaryotic-like serine/threonine-protein kinase
MTAQWFGDYEILERLRVGGMATLYLARRHGAAGFSRLVALKVIHPQLAEQASFVDMFVDEARICAQISHPNVVHVEEFGVLDGVHYLVMEYVDGCSASELLQVLRRDRRMLDPELAARAIMQVAGGLHAAHETCGPDGQPLDLIHRDISPSNILVSVDGHAKLIDFGIAKARNRISETQAGFTLKGKCRYVAPEQALHAAVDRRCDLFSLGIVFWELLAGRQLFPDDSHAGLINRLRQTDVPAPSAVNPCVPAVFDPIVLAMLRHDPADRLQTAAEVQRRIASAIPGAANREAADLGALAIEVRDKCAERRARRASAESPGSDSDRNFSPLRSPRPQTFAGPRVELEDAPRSGVPDASPPAPPPWWRRRGLQIGAGLVGAGLVLAIVLGHRGTEADASASAASRPARDRESERVVRREPVTRVQAPALRPALPSPPAAESTQRSELPTPAGSPPPTAIAAPPPERVSPATATAGPAQGLAATPPIAAPRREVARVAAKPRPRPAASEAETARPAAPPHAPRAGVKTPFAAESFDEAANTSGASAPPAVAKDKPARIAPQFDN